MAMKLDMRKLMKYFMPDNGKNGFDDKWIQIIFGYISSVSYSIFVNEEPQGIIKPTGGLR